jgi:membrane-associated phospholipid phosphatase
MSFFARPLALVILAVLLLVALVRARVTGFGGTDLDRIADLAWAVIGAALAYVVSLPVVHLVARARPFLVLPKAAVLVTRPAGFSFPNEHTVIAGALATGIWLGRSRVLAVLATLVALIIALAVVYSGVAYPGDAAAGLLMGMLVTLGLYPIAIGSLRELVHLVARSSLKSIVGGGRRRPVGPGPAARPEQVGDSGAVRVLAPEEVRAVRALPSGRTRTTRVLPPGEAGTVRILPPEETGAGAGVAQE